MMNEGGDRERAVVDVVWAATSPTSGRFDPVETSSDLCVLDDRVAVLRDRGSGYLEVRRTEDYPVITLGFNGSAAVVQALTSAEEMALLKGDGSVVGESVEVPIMDDVTGFDALAGLRLDRAWNLVRAFLQGSELEELGEWLGL